MSVCTGTWGLTLTWPLRAAWAPESQGTSWPYSIPSSVCGPLCLSSLETDTGFLAQLQSSICCKNLKCQKPLTADLVTWRFPPVRIGLASLPGSIHVVILPLDVDPHWLIDPLLLRWEGVDLVGLPVVRTPRGSHVGLGEMGRRSVC